MDVQNILPPISAALKTVPNFLKQESHSNNYESPQRDARGTLLVPMWESSYFWPLIYPNGLHPAPFIKDIIVVDPWYQSERIHNVFQGRQVFKTVAIKVDFTV